MSFHSKIIKVSLKDKDMSWQLDIIYSSIRVLQTTFNYIFFALTYMIPNLYLYTGTWFCYASKMIMYYNGIIITNYTLMVAILKYVVIVHWQKARAFGHDEIRKLFSFLLAFGYPIITLIINFAIRADFIFVYDGYKQVDMCLGDPKGYWVEGTNQTQTKLHTLCLQIAEPASTDHWQYFLSYFLKGICWFEIIFRYLSFWNLLDCIIYFNIFLVMHRWAFS